MEYEAWGRADKAPENALAVFGARGIAKLDLRSGWVFDVPPDRKDWKAVDDASKERLRNWLVDNHSRIMRKLNKARGGFSWDAPWRHEDGPFVYEITINGGYAYIGAWLVPS